MNIASSAVTTKSDAASATATVAATDRSAEIAINKADTELLLSFFTPPPLSLTSECLSKVPQPLVGRDNADNTLANTKPLDPLPQRHYLLNPPSSRNPPLPLDKHALRGSPSTILVNWMTPRTVKRPTRTPTHTYRERKRERETVA